MSNIKNDNINLLKELIKVGHDTQHSIGRIKSQFNDVMGVVAEREKQFKAENKAKLAEGSEVAENTNVAAVESKPVVSADATKVEANTAKVEANTAKVEVATKESKPKAVRLENADNNKNKDTAANTATEAKTPDNTTKAGVTVSQTADGRKIVTSTDEKGKTITKKFWDPNAAAKKPERPARPANNNNGRNGGQGNNNYQGRRDGGRPPYNNNNGGNNNGRNDYQNRSQQPNNRQGAGSTNGAPSMSSYAPIDFKPNDRNNAANKRKNYKADDKRTANKKTGGVTTRNFNDMNYDEDRVVRRARKKDSGYKNVVVAPKITHAVIEGQDVSIKVLAEKIGITAATIVTELFKEGILKTINDRVEFDVAEYIASKFDVTLELKEETSAEEMVVNGYDDDGLMDDTKRSPIVTVMGHVDHGKTSLLDAIRKTNVTSGEAGGITQHIGAYTVETNGEKITFIDTPGHAAFTAMRARGAKVTDVAIIVVAGDDGVMPQTIEAINHAKAAGVSIVVAINKMDRPNTNIDTVLTQLSEHELLAEQWGGDIIMVPVSAKTGMGIDKLLEAVILVTEIKELKANVKKKATGTIIESRLDKGRGVVATILVSNGTLKLGDYVVAGTSTAKVKAMFDDKGKKVNSAGPSIPVEVLGFNEVPEAGEFMYAGEEKLIKKVAEERVNKLRAEKDQRPRNISLTDVYSKISEGQLKVLNIIIKTDVNGSLEALKSTLAKISNDEVRVNPIHGGVGAINESDVMLARASDAIIIGFNVRADAKAKAVAEKENVDIKLYSVIYDAVDDITAAMKGMLEPKFREQALGTVEVRDVFKITGVGAVAGSYVTNGKVTRTASVRIYRNDVVVYTGKILALKRFKDDVKEVASGYECGISIENYNDIKAGDIFEVFSMEEINE